MGILVTGGAGFIGSNMTEELVKRGGNVTVIDNMHTGSLKNLDGIKDGIKFINSDVRNMGNLGLKDIDLIFHFGIPSSSSMYKENPFLVGDATNGFISVLEHARRNDSRLVFASSSSVYNGLEPPHREDMEIKVTDYYTECRIVMERLARLYNILYGIESIGLRLFSVYGKHEKAKGKFANVVSQFMWSMQGGKSPVIYGDGKQTRDYVYVKDVVRAAMLAMDSPIKCDIFNVGTGKSTSTNDLITMLNRILGKKIKPGYVDNPIKNYVFHTTADCKKAEQKLNFKAKYGLEEGIRDVLSSGSE